MKGDDAENIRGANSETEHGPDAEIIGKVRAEHPGMVLLKTLVGSTRVLRKPLGEPIPRVC